MAPSRSAICEIVIHSFVGLRPMIDTYRHGRSIATGETSIAMRSVSGLVAVVLLIAGCGDGDNPTGGNESTSPEVETTAADSQCGPEPARTPLVERQRYGDPDELRRELAGGLLRPLPEALTELAAAMRAAGHDDIADNIWEEATVTAVLDPPIPLRLLDDIEERFPEGTVFMAAGEGPPTGPFSLYGPGADNFLEQIPYILGASTTTTTPDGSTAPAFTVPEDLIWDLRVVIPAYGVPATSLRDGGLDQLPLRDLVYGVELEIRGGPSGVGWPNDHIIDEHVGWTWCVDLVDQLGL